MIDTSEFSGWTWKRSLCNLGAFFKLFVKFFFFFNFYSVIFFFFVPVSLEALVSSQLKKWWIVGGPEASSWWLMVSVTFMWKSSCRYWQEGRVPLPRVSASSRMLFQMSWGVQWSLSPSPTASREYTPQADAFSHRMGTPVIAYIWHPRSHHKVGRDQSHTEKDVSVGMTPSKAVVSWVEVTQGGRTTWELCSQQEGLRLGLY